MTGFLDSIVAPLNGRRAELCRPFEAGALLAIEPETVEVRAEVDGAGPAPRLRAITLGFSRALQQPHPAREGWFARLAESLALLAADLAELAEAQTETMALRLSLSDGGANEATTVVFDRDRRTAARLMPDLYVLQEAAVRRFHPPLSPAEFREAFLRKRAMLFWRGSTTGHIEGGTLAGLAQNARVRACRFIRAALGPRGDARIAQIHGVRPEFTAAAAAWLDSEAIRGAWVDEAEFGAHQVYLDLPGNAAAWGSYRKYLKGCLVLRPAGERELLYYGLQQPWVHFIPIAADLADLPAAMDWVAGHPHEAAAIAHAGRRLIIDYLSGTRGHVAAALRAALHAPAAPPAPSPEG